MYILFDLTILFSLTMATVHAHPRMQTPTREYASNAPDSSSPTLTNPDMILPYREHHSSPSTSPNSDLIRSASFSRRNGLQLVPPDTTIEVGVAKTFAAPIRTKPAPAKTVTIPHHGYEHSYEHGAPLSVIGEEETTPRSNRAKNRSPSPEDPSTPTRPTQSTQKNAKRLSIQSDSSLGSDVANWEDLNGLKTSNPRLQADLAKEEDDIADNDCLKSKRNSGFASDDEDMKRAERILANAKKRLTVC